MGRSIRCSRRCYVHHPVALTFLILSGLGICMTILTATIARAQSGTYLITGCLGDSTNTPNSACIDSDSKFERPRSIDCPSGVSPLTYFDVYRIDTVNAGTWHFATNGELCDAAGNCGHTTFDSVLILYKTSFDPGLSCVGMIEYEDTSSFSPNRGEKISIELDGNSVYYLVVTSVRCWNCGGNGPYTLATEPPVGGTCSGG